MRLLLVVVLGCGCSWRQVGCVVGTAALLTAQAIGAGLAANADRAPPDDDTPEIAVAASGRSSDEIRRWSCGESGYYLKLRG
jgi:hypothetical protein